jgi:uncharacterized protein (TIGR03435 family)
MMRTTAARIAWICFAGGLAYGQTFEAASVKPAVMPKPDAQGRMVFTHPSGGPGTSDPGRIDYPNMNLRALLLSAYNVKAFQLVGPDWLNSATFDITATMRPDTTKDQFRVMLQHLLADRFKMKAHRETKQLPVYSLVVAKGGPKLQGKAAPPAPQSKPGPDGRTLPAPTGPVMMMTGRGRILARQQSMRDLANFLTIQVGAPVTDGTALTEKYDFTLTYSPEGLNGPASASGSDNPDAPTLFAAVQAQLGLKLESRQGPVELVVIDHIEKTPTGN